MLSEEIKAFLRASIKSIWALELLLFLHGHSDQTWSVAALTRKLRASEPLVRASLTLFQAAHLVREDVDGHVRFSPGSPILDRLVRELAETYATHPVAVSDEIYVSDSKIRDFANAFRIKKE